MNNNHILSKPQDALEHNILYIKLSILFDRQKYM